MPQGLPLFKPPYSRMTAIDLNAGEHAWMQPNGDGDRLRNHPLLRDLDLPPLGGEGHGGPLLTRTLLVSALSAGGTGGGPRLVARDKAGGAIVGSVDLPSGAIGTPMTYMYEGILGEAANGHELARQWLLVGYHQATVPDRSP